MELNSLRPSGSGRPARCSAFLRASAVPRCALIFETDADPPGDWPTATGVDVTDAQLGHALGWVCEVRAADVVILNPLGEGALRADLPDLPEEWLTEAALGDSTAIYLLPSSKNDDLAEARLSELAVAEPIPAASVRTSVSADVGKMPTVGRNQPCPCGSGKKFKHCHG